MGWFDEQIRQRRESDDAVFEAAFLDIAGAVMGRRLTDALEDRQAAQDAIDAVLRYYRIRPAALDIPEKVKTLDERLNYCLRPYGILRRPVLLEEGWQNRAAGPMLGTTKAEGTAVALLPGELGGYTMTDLHTGRQTRITRRNAGLLDDEAICFYQPLPQRSLRIADLLKYIFGQYSTVDLVPMVGMMALSTFVGLLSPLFTKWLFGTVLESGSVRVLLALAGFMMSYTLSRTLMNVYASLVRERVKTKQDVAVEAAVMARILSLPATFFRQFSAGELTQRAQYVRSLCAIMMESLFNTGLSALLSLVYIGQIFVFAPGLVIPAILTTLATVVITGTVSLLQSRISRERMELGSKESGMTYSMITGIQKIRLAGAEKRMFARWAKLFSKLVRLEYDPPLLLRQSATLQLAVSLTGSWVMYAMSLRSGLSIPDYYAFLSAYGMMSGAFLSLSGLAVTIATIRPVLEMTRPILEAEPETAEGKEIITELRGAIELSHVSFRYNESMPLVLDDISLNIRAGEYVAIVGSTGCGKSTLMRLLLGFEKPQRGAVYFDRKDITRVDLHSLRRCIGSVTQDGKLFQGDIYSNIVISAPELPLSEAWKAAEIAGLADDIRAMPMGMYTMIAEGQGGISGGQRQRMMIARAIAPKPRVLLFDEATSALDNITQKKVSEAIDALKCTRVVIAHRLSTIRHCDRILVLDKGHIIEQGTYEELIARGGFFAALVERQRLDVETE